MLSEDQYLDRTPDLIAKVRKMREAAEKEMNKFTRVADYDVRRVVGRKPRELFAANQDAAHFPANNGPVEASAQPASNQRAMEFPPTPVASDEDEESA